MAGVFVLIAIISCLASSVFAKSVTNKDEAGSESIPAMLLAQEFKSNVSKDAVLNSQHCSPTTQCLAGFHCCSTVTCCPNYRFCCGGGGSCCTHSGSPAVKSMVGVTAFTFLMHITRTWL